jgi:hypothetical protein
LKNEAEALEDDMALLSGASVSLAKELSRRTEASSGKELSGEESRVEEGDRSRESSLS